MRSAIVARLRGVSCRIRNSPRLRLGVLAAVVLSLMAVLLFRGLRQGMAAGGRPNDFAAYHAAAQGVLRGDLAASYSAETPYQYPPTLAVLAAPLGLLPVRAAAAVWTLGSLAVLLWTFRALGTALGPEVGGLDQALGFLLIYRMAESDFSNGNANTMVLGLLVLGFLLHRRGRPVTGGGILGLAAAIKVTPAIFLAWLLFQKRWRMALGFVAGAALGGIAFPALVLGPVPYARAYAEFYRTTVSPLNVADERYGGEAPGGYLAGQSLRALLHRLLRDIDATAHDRAAASVNLLDLPKGAVDAIYLACAAGFLAFLLFRFRGSRDWSGPEIGAAAAAMVLLAPLSRKAHFVALFPAAVAGFAAIRLSAGRSKALHAALWWTAFALCVLSAPGTIGRPASTFLLAFCPLGLAALLLGVLCALARRYDPAGGSSP